MNSLTYNTLVGILQRDFHLAPEKIQPNATLVELGLDSLALMEFVFAIEDAFCLRIPEDRLDPREAGLTLQRLCTIIEEAIQPPAMATPATAAAQAA